MLDIEIKAKEILEKFFLFTHGYRVCMLIDRGVANSNKGSRRWVSKLMSHDMPTLKENICKLLHQQKYLSDPDTRLYMNLNSRSLHKAVEEFHHRTIDVIYHGCLDNAREKFFTKINDTFCSCLMQPGNREETKFLIDWDSKQPLSLPSEIVEIFRYETPNGWHVITEPFNPAIKPEWDVKKDALILLNTLEAE